MKSIDERQGDKRQEQTEELERQREGRKADLFARVDELVADFAHTPEQIGLYLAELEASGRLEDGDREAVFTRVLSRAGVDMAERAFGLLTEAHLGTTDIVAALSADARKLAGGAATAAGNIVDLDAERAARTARLLESLAGALGLAAQSIDVRVDDEAARRTESRGAHGLMEEGTVFLHPDAYDPSTAGGRALLGHEVAHVAQRAEVQPSSEVAPSKGAAEMEAASFGATFAAGGPLTRPQSVLPYADIAADTDAPAKDEKKDKQQPIELTITGPGGLVHKVTVKPGHKTKNTVPNWNIPGVTISKVELHFKDEHTLESGVAKGKIDAGPFKQDFTLKVMPHGATGAKLELTFEGEFKMPGLIKPIGTKVTITEKGIAADLTVAEHDSELTGMKTAGSVHIESKGKGVEASGTIRLWDEDDKLAGDVTVSYKGGHIGVTGFLDVKGMNFLFDEGEVKLKVVYDGAKTTTTLENAPLTKTKDHEHVTTVTTVQSLEFKSGGGGVTGKGKLESEFKNVGKASGELTIKNGILEEVVLSFDGFTFRVPKEGEEPLITGALDGDVTFKDAGDGVQFTAGQITGNFGVRLPGGGEGGQTVPLKVDLKVLGEGQVTATFSLA